jgi:hypothetical protein
VTPSELSEAVALLSRQRRQAGAYLRRRARVQQSQLRVPRGLVLDAFIATGSYARAAVACRVSRRCVRDLIRATLKHLESGTVKAPSIPGGAR